MNSRLIISSFLLFFLLIIGNLVNLQAQERLSDLIEDKLIEKQKNPSKLKLYLND